ncbi:hypothetical protein CAPTEDRAFT_185940 [Capitella teleta]|uniref:SUEL-type lectin domain-containing protein n=1 Tax=Capitella teleta TaxID=283909 RepID=R7UXU4_CAPTE|nr:hypothetical protein CAPTEDRAFT_185940 [Capitella teleta]|eukprot:ELU08236.1 hypothetical protein CAPTEDRAFT_185940 [Capitella teleta]
MNKSMLLLLVVIGVCAALPQSGEREESGRGGNRRGGGRGGRGGDGRSRRGGPRLLCNIEGDSEIPQDRRPTGECPGDSTCSIGPIDVDHDGRQASISFCDAQDAQGNLLIFRGACRIERSSRIACLHTVAPTSAMAESNSKMSLDASIHIKHQYSF